MTQRCAGCGRLVGAALPHACPPIRLPTVSKQELWQARKRALGLCYICGRRPAASAGKRCLACARRQSARRRARRAEAAR